MINMLLLIVRENEPFRRVVVTLEEIITEGKHEKKTKPVLEFILCTGFFKLLAFGYNLSIFLRRFTEMKSWLQKKWNNGKMLAELKPAFFLSLTFVL